MESSGRIIRRGEFGTEDFGREPIHGLPNQLATGWSWRAPRRGEHFRTCNYCGCIHPGDLWAEDGWQASWADRKYGWPHKFYVDIPNLQPGTIFAIGSSYGTAETGHGWVVAAGLTPELLEIAKLDRIVRPDRSLPTAVMFGTRRLHSAKFYSAHLADPAVEPGARNAIQQACGLQFSFSGATVFWRSYVSN